MRDERRDIYFSNDSIPLMQLHLNQPAFNNIFFPTSQDCFSYSQDFCKLLYPDDEKEGDVTLFLSKRMCLFNAQDYSHVSGKQEKDRKKKVGKRASKNQRIVCLVQMKSKKQDCRDPREKNQKSKNFREHWELIQTFKGCC